MHIEPFVYYLFMTHPTACIRFTDRPASGLDLLALAPSAEIGRSVGPPHPQPERASRPVVDASHEVSRRALPSHKFWAGRARALARRTPAAPTEHRPCPLLPSSPPVCSLHYCNPATAPYLPSAGCYDTAPLNLPNQSNL